MIELVFLACLAASPERCEEKSLLFTEITPIQCVMGAQVELAKWNEKNPQWVIHYFKCQQMRRGKLA